MNGETYISNVKSLKNNYIIHFILHGLAIVYNFILIIYVFWLDNLLYNLYFSICIFVILYILIPIIPFIYVILKKLTKKYIKIFKILSTIFCVLVLITGLCFTVILMVNTLQSSDFCRECPFNLPTSYINSIYMDYSTNEISNADLKDYCQNRRCIFNNNLLDNPYSYEYICNYNPEGEFDSIKNESNLNQTLEQMICQNIDSNTNYNNYYFKEININYFFEMCNSYNQFFICQRITKPKKYHINDNFICPKKHYLMRLLVLCLISVVFNLILCFIPWRLEYSKYKKIIQSFNIRIVREGNRSLNSTQMSKANKENIEESFKKQPTETIIVYNETGDNMVTQINNSNDNDKYTDNDINNDNNIKNDNDIKNENKIRSKNKNEDNNINNNINKKTISINMDIANEMNSNKLVKRQVSNKIINKKNIVLKKNISEKMSNKQNSIVNNKTNNKTNNKSNNKANNEKNKKDDNSIRIFRVSESPAKKKDNKKLKEKEEVFVRSNSYKISYFSDRNILEESEPNM